MNSDAFKEAQLFLQFFEQMKLAYEEKAAEVAKALEHLCHRIT